MDKKPSKIDIVNEVLEDCIMAYPVSSFIISLYKQYLQRGSLSKKQLEGLLAKAAKAQIAASKLATLEALIKRMPTRTKSQMPENTPLYQRDEAAGELINTILRRYPEHKRVLFLQSKWANNEVLSSADLADLKRFYSALK